MNLLTIYRREMISYFRSLIAYNVIFGFGVISGYFFFAATASFVIQSQRSLMMGQSVPMDVNEYVVRSLLSNISVIGLFMCPMITMRLFAEEKRTGTIELLVTSPLRDYEVIIGKWLAALTLYAAMLALSLVNLLSLYFYGKPDWKPMMIGYLGLLLQGGCMLALGGFVSACTKDQIVACVGGFWILLLLWVISWVSSLDSTPILKVVGYLSILDHMDSFSKGVLDSKDAIFFISMIFLGLFLTGRAMESIRWRA